MQLKCKSNFKLLVYYKNKGIVHIVGDGRRKIWANLKFRQYKSDIPVMTLIKRHALLAWKTSNFANFVTK